MLACSKLALAARIWCVEKGAGKGPPPKSCPAEQQAAGNGAYDSTDGFPAPNVI